MADLLGTGLSSLRAMRRALDTTAHNIANVSTPGYSRQTVDFATRQPEAYGSNWIGTGVNATSVRRVYDSFVQMQVRNSSSSFARLEAFASQAERLDNLLGDPSNGLGASFTSFTNAISEVSSTPNSIAARQVLLAEGRALAERLRTYDARLREMSEGIDTQIVSETGEINTIARGIARLNSEIAVAVQHTGHAPNDLLDQRDVLIDELAGKLGITVVPDGESSVNVFIGNGQPLVLGTSAAQITTKTDPLDPERLRLALQVPGGPIDISSMVTGGTLGGLIDWRREMLDPVRNELGRISLAVAEQMNAQHRLGMDLAGAMGDDFFNVGAVGVNGALTNTGNGSISVTRTDVGALTGANYTLTRTNTGYELRRADTGALVNFTGTGAAGDPIRAEGLAITVAPGMDVNDRFLIRPTRDAIQGFGVAVTDPARVAAAAPLRTGAASTNTGTGTISAGEVANLGALDLSQVDIVFTSATTYSINGGADQAFVPGDAIEFNGWRVSISGSPAAGDTFTVRSNAGAVGDNRNALALADALRAGVIEGGTVSVTAAVERMTGELGLATRAAQINRDAEAVVHENDLATRDSISGVNLDEEAANMIRFQQAYAASAQIIAVAGTLFDTLLAAVRR